MATKVESTKPDFSQRLTEFLGRNRTFIAVLSVVVVVGIVATLAIFQIQENRDEAATRAIELVDENFQRWQELAPDDGERETLAEEIRQGVAAVRSDYPGSYGELRGLHILALLEWGLERYSDSTAAFMTIPERFPESHLVAIALSGAASAAELSGDVSQAQDFLERIVAGEGGPSVEQGRALFNLGRLAEQQGNPAGALQHYRDLEERFPRGSWTNLARNRIIRLTIEGVSTDT